MSTKIGVDLTDTPSDSTTADTRFDLPGFKLGDRHLDQNGHTYMYVHASGAITQYMAVAIDEDYEAYALTKALADAGNKIGIACATFADNDYGWALVRGKSPLLVLASCAADVALYTSGSAGYLDDATLSQTKISGVVLQASIGTNAGSQTAHVTIEPFVAI